MTITLVGDVKQTLYTFRQANHQFLEHLDKLLPEVQEGVLLSNYRSPMQHVALANELLQLFISIDAKPSAFIRNPISQSVQVHRFNTSNEELIYISKQIDSLIKGGTNPKDIVVLSRTNRYLQFVEAALIPRRIPYTIRYDSRTFLKSSPFKFYYGVLSLLLNPRDYFALREILLHVKGIGTKFLSSLYQSIKPYLSNPDFYILRDLPNILNLSSKNAVSIHNIINNFLKPIRTTYLMPESGVSEVIKSITYNTQQAFNLDSSKESSPEKPYIDLNYPQLVKVNNTLMTVYDLLYTEYEFTNSSKEDQMNLFYQSLQLTQDIVPDEEAENELDQVKKYKSKKEENREKNKRKDSVMLTTIHAYKGLESKVVFLPNQQPLYPPQLYDFDELCVFYVAVTRATHSLYLTTANMVFDYAHKLKSSANNPILEYYLSGFQAVREKIEKALKDAKS